MNIREHANDTTIRAGILIRLKGTNKILIEHATGKHPPLPCKDIPKGHVTADEPIMEGACREVKEETGLDIDILDLVPLGVYKYQKSVLHLFYTEMDFDIGQCHCDSKFKSPSGKMLPEVDGYELFDMVSDNLDDSLVYISLRPILKDIFKKIMQYN